MSSHEWSLPNKPVQLDGYGYHKKSVAAIIAISKEKTCDLVMCFPKSVDRFKFMEFLRKLREKFPFDKLAVFLD